MLERDMSDILDPFSPGRYCAVASTQVPSQPSARLGEFSKQSRRGHVGRKISWFGMGQDGSHLPMVLAKAVVQAYELA